MISSHKGFVPILPGTRVLHNDRQYEVAAEVSSNRIQCIDLETKNCTYLCIDEVKPVRDQAVLESGPSPDPAVDLLGFTAEQWSEARKRFAIIRPFVDGVQLSVGDVAKLADDNSIDPSTIYRWLRIYAKEGQVAALVPSKPGPRPGTRYLRPERERVISATIEDLYLCKQRHRKGDVVEEVKRRCLRAGIQAPNPGTILKRIAALSPVEVLQRQGRRDAARNRYEALRGAFPGATYPLAVVQIDHTRVDLVVVDEVHRLPVSRPWLTLAIDVYSRMVAGIHLGFEAPSSTTAGLCLAHAICQKHEYLTQLGIAGKWPVWGRMRTVHADNGAEFHSKVLERACENLGIDTNFRAIPKPHWGGHIERLMGTISRQIHKLPGTTFSNPTHRDGYDSEANAALTIRELEQIIVEFIVNNYHQDVHSELSLTPLKRWELGISGEGSTKGTGTFEVPTDPERVRLEFLPYEERSVQRYGIVINGVRYYDPILDPYVNRTDPKCPSKKLKHTIRRDPRDISKIYFLDPTDKQYYVIPYRNTGLPAISLQELKMAKKKLRERGEKSSDVTAVFSAIEINRSRVDDALRKTKTARREAARRPKSAPVASESSSASQPSTSISSSKMTDLSSPEMTDLFSVPIVPFDIISSVR